MSDAWRKTLLPLAATLQDAITSLNASGVQIVLVVGEDGTLDGTITDGDIRRGLLAGMHLGSPMTDVINRNPLVVPPQWSREMALQLMHANKIHQLPVIDEGRRVVGLHLWSEMTESPERDNVMVLMAGGQGSRLRPHTERCPKPLLPVNGKPMLEHIVDRARGQGFRRFIVAIHYLGQLIEDHFGDGSAFGVEIRYVREESPLGTAGALSLLAPRPSAPFIVSNGDVLSDIHYGDLLDFHRRHAATATMAVRLYEWQHPFGVVRTSGVDIVGFEEKPVSRSHINAGVYALEPSALDVLARDEVCDMPLLFTRLQDAGARTVVFPMHEPWLDVGRPDDWARAETRRPMYHSVAPDGRIKQEME